VRSGHRKTFRKARHYCIHSEWRQRSDDDRDCGPDAGVPARQEAAARDIIARMRLSARNRLVGIITEIKLGDIMAHVTIKVGEHLIESVITRRSAEEMSLHLGDTVAAVIKSTEVMVEKA
jgi:molybdopterin-binding protein